MQGRAMDIHGLCATYPGLGLDWDGLRVLGRTLNQTLPGLWLDGTAYLAGGAIVRALAGEPMKDLDVWVYRGALDGYIRHLKGADWTQSTEPRGKDYAPLYRRLMEQEGQKWTLDLIAYHFGPPAEVFGRFDFRAAAVAFDGRQLWAADGALEDIAAKRLTVLRRTRLERIERYQERGWTLTVDLADAVLSTNSRWDQTMGESPVAVGNAI